MSIDVSALIGPDEVMSIAEDVWSSLVGDDEVLVPSDGLVPLLPLDAISAWVLVVGPWSGSLVVTCAPGTAMDLTRSILRAEDDEEFSTADVADALGELANVIGGNVKSLLIDPSVLGLPQIGLGMDSPTGEVVVQLDLSWRGQQVCLSLRSAATATAPIEKELS